MVEDVVAEPMTEEFILWRCLHDGPLSRETIEKWSSGSTLPFEHYRKRNLPLLAKLTRTYGACAWSFEPTNGEFTVCSSSRLK